MQFLIGYILIPSYQFDNRGKRNSITTFELSYVQMQNFKQDTKSWKDNILHAYPTQQLQINCNA